MKLAVAALVAFAIGAWIGFIVAAVMAADRREK